MKHPRHFYPVIGFVTVGLLWRLLFLPVSQSTYTDGVLQLETFRLGISYWPPLFPLLAQLLALLPGLGLEGGGRLVSILAGTWVFVPLAIVSAKLYGWRAARWSMVLWLVSPLAMRWSLQPMTDMLAASLWASALGAWVLAAQALRPECFADEQARSNAAEGRGWLLLAALAGALATLTRYQGIFLFLPSVLMLWVLRRGNAGDMVRRGAPWWTLAPWLAVPLWLLREGPAPLLRHFEQISDRSQSAGWLQTFTQIYWNQFEQFIATSPYWLTWGIFGVLLYGLFRTRWATPRLLCFGALALYGALAIVALQSVFSSFQFRYMLPLVPMVCVFGGHGLATWERHNEKRRVMRWALAAPVVLYALVFTSLVMVYQGSPFREFKQAGEYLAGLELAEGQQILSNETYNAKLPGPHKLRFWSGREDIDSLGAVPLRPGDILVLSSFYAGEPARYAQMIAQLQKSWRVEKLEQFSHRLYPLLPNLTDKAIMHDNPLAWQVRYQPQRFEIIIFKLVAPMNMSAQIDDTVLQEGQVPTVAPSERKLELIETLKDVAREREAIGELLNDNGESDEE